MIAFAPSAARPVHAVAAAVPHAVDDTLVPGLRLPSIAGLPGIDTPGVPLRRLPNPPAPGSAAYRADLDAVKAAQELRTPAGDAWAVHMAEEGTLRLWTDLARRQLTISGRPQEWLETALVAATLGVNAATTGIAKRRFQRERPFQVDPTIVPPVDRPRNSSYPSGHASSAYAAARVIATMEPSLAGEAYRLAQQVAVSRVYAGVHFPTDVVAGALLGTSVADAVLRRRNLDGAAA